MKRLIKKVLSNTKFVKNRYLNFLFNYSKERYIKYSGMNSDNKELIAAKMRLIIHPIEKGMSLYEPKAEFGKQKIIELINLFEQYEKSDGKKDYQVLELAKSVIHNYIQFQKKFNMDLSFIPERFFEFSGNDIAGAMPFNKQQFNSLSNFALIAKNRHSVRNFSGEKIDRDTIKSAIELAQTSPSACNRQATRIYVCDNDDKLKQIMSKHGGMRGFSGVSGIIAITGELSMYQNEFERDVIFVDGGIFLMNLLYSLQSFGIANCPIIWGSEPDNDRFLYNLLNIPESETIVALTMIGGFPGDEVKVARSYKRPVDDILKFI